MRVEHEGQRYVVKFFHSRGADRQAIERLRESTTCIIEREVDNDGNVPEMLARAEAVCHPGEQFSKERGRKLAFGRALRQLGDSRRRTLPETGIATQRPEVLALRRAFWDAYFARVPTRDVAVIALPDGDEG